MHDSRRSVGVGVSLLLIFFSGCRGGGPPRTSPVQIDIWKVDAKNCDVSNRSADLSIKGHNVAVWKSKDQNYTVLFSSGTPFKNQQGQPITSFAVNPPSATVTPVPSTKGYFEYSINDQNSQECKNAKDPGLNVKD
jgi:hypothetical protein